MREQYDETASIGMGGARLRGADDPKGSTLADRMQELRDRAVRVRSGAREISQRLWPSPPAPEAGDLVKAGRGPTIPDLAGLSCDVLAEAESILEEICKRLG